MTCPISVEGDGSLMEALLLTSHFFNNIAAFVMKLSMCGWQIPEYFNILDFKRLQFDTGVPLCSYGRLQWNLQIKDTLGAQLLYSFRRLSFGGRCKPICNL